MFDNLSFVFVCIRETNLKILNDFSSLYVKSVQIVKFEQIFKDSQMALAHNTKFKLIFMLISNQ